MVEIGRTARRVCSALEKLRVPFYVGGSVAAGIYATPRMTRDLDVIASMGVEHIPDLVRELEGDCYIDAGMIADAIARRASFNVIHLATMMKVDIFVSPDTLWAHEKMSRRVERTIPGEEYVIPVCSAEDLVLQKIVWFLESHSELQWRDVVDLLTIRAEDLDRAYLSHWALMLGLTALLAQAEHDAGWRDEGATQR